MTWKYGKIWWDDLKKEEHLWQVLRLIQFRCKKCWCKPLWLCIDQRFNTFYPSFWSQTLHRMFLQSATTNIQFVFPLAFSLLSHSVWHLAFAVKYGYIKALAKIFRNLYDALQRLSSNWIIYAEVKLFWLQMGSEISSHHLFQEGSQSLDWYGFRGGWFTGPMI